MRKAITIVLIATAVVSFWRGVWGLLDLYLFPANPTLSLLTSLVLGLLILLATHHLVDKLP